MQVKLRNNIGTAEFPTVFELHVVLPGMYGEWLTFFLLKKKADLTPPGQVHKSTDGTL